eukprot:1279812-Prymnesium_polylepis.2
MTSPPPQSSAAVCDGASVGLPALRCVSPRRALSVTHRLLAATGPPVTVHNLRCRREDITVNNNALLEKERQMRHDEVAIDLEDRATKKGTPPVPNETGDIRNLRRGGGNPSAQLND